MRHISIGFGGVDQRPITEREKKASAERLVNMTCSDGVLKPISVRTYDDIGVESGSSIVGIHQTTGYQHVILSHPGNTYSWADTTTGTVHALAGPGGKTVTGMSAVGDIVTLQTTDGPVHVLWQASADDYQYLDPAMLGYDLTVSQDSQYKVSASLPIDSKLRPYLTSPESPLRSRPDVSQRIFDGCYDEEGSYATGATLIRAAAEGALDQVLAGTDGSYHKHVVFGIATIRLFDGSHTSLSPVFALIPAMTTDSVSIDPDEDTVRIESWLHRHTIRATLHDAGTATASLVSGIDIYLSRPVTFTSPNVSSRVSRDAQGRVTALTYPYLDMAHTMALWQGLDYHHALHIGIDDMQKDILVSTPSASAEKADLTNWGLVRYGGGATGSVGDRLHIADVSTIMGNPLRIGISYRYATLGKDERQSSPQGRDSELLAGIRPDIGDNPIGSTAQAVLVYTLDDSQHSKVAYSGTVPYPIAGAMQAGSRHVTAIEAHLAIGTGSARQYYVRRETVRHAPDHDLSACIYSPLSGTHSSSRPAFATLLMQEVHAVAYDDSTAQYEWSHDLWQEESQAEYNAAHAIARDQWTIGRHPQRMQWSAAGNPLIMSESDHTDIGQTAIRQLLPGTRRTANGLIGEYPLYAINDEGIWALRVSKSEGWVANQPMVRDSPLAGTNAVATDEALYYAGKRGVMRLKGNTLTCISGVLDQVSLDGAVLYYDTTSALLLVACEGVSWVYNTASDSWSTVTMDSGQVVGEWMLRAVTADGDGTGTRHVVSRIGVGQATGSVDVELQTRQFAWDGTLLRRRLRSLWLCGCLSYNKLTGNDMARVTASVRIRVEGSDDCVNWHCIGYGITAINGISGSPYRWFRIAVYGRLSPAHFISHAIGVVG